MGDVDAKVVVIGDEPCCAGSSQRVHHVLEHDLDRLVSIGLLDQGGRAASDQLVEHLVMSG